MVVVIPLWHCFTIKYSKLHRMLNFRDCDGSPPAFMDLFTKQFQFSIIFRAILVQRPETMPWPVASYSTNIFMSMPCLLYFWLCMDVAMFLARTGQFLILTCHQDWYKQLWKKMINKNILALPRAKSDVNYSNQQAQLRAITNLENVVKNVHSLPYYKALSCFDSSSVYMFSKLFFPLSLS